MDDIDIKILSLLQDNARATASEIGGKISMSVSAVIERIKKLESNGIIKKYAAILNHETIGLCLTAMISITLEHPKFIESFSLFIKNHNQILEAYYVAGDVDYILKVVCDSPAALERLLNEIKSASGVQKTATTVVLSNVKCTYSVNPECLR